MPSATRVDTARTGRAMSLRLRLTMWVLVVFVVLQTCTLGALWLYERATIQGNFNYRLLERAREAQDSIDSHTGSLTRQDVESLLDARFRNERYGTRIVGIFDATGRDAVTDGLHRLGWNELKFEQTPVPGTMVYTRIDAPATPHPATYGFTAAEPGDTMLVGVFGLSDKVKQQTGAAAIAFAMEKSHIDQRIAIVTEVGTIGGAISFVAAAIGAWFIAGMAISPLNRLRLFAERLRPESIGEKLDDKDSHPEIVRLNRELEKALARIQDGFIAQERFLSNVSHEFKTPIAVLLIESQTVNRRNAPPEMSAFVDSVSSEMGRLSRLVESFLTLTRVRDGKGLSMMRNYAANDLVIDTLGNCSLMARQHNVRLEPELLSDETELATCVRGDPELLRTMLDNLVRNAVRFSPEGGVVKVGLRCERGPMQTESVNGNGHASVVTPTSSAGTLVITVSDRGPGIPNDRLTTIFDRFAQAHTGEKHGRGHGLGLPIALGIAELHAGTIRAFNRTTEQGCEFVVRMPISNPDDEPKA